MADTSVKYFHSDMRGAPVLDGTAGSLIGLLRATLVDGFGLANVDSVSVKNGVATLKVSAGHSAEAGCVILVAGSPVDALNGEQRVTATTPASVSFATTLSDQDITGAITVKQAPGGWEMPFNANNKAAFRSANVKSTRRFAFIDDTFGMYAKICGYESMTAIDAGVNRFPSTSQITDVFWTKSNAANKAARRWMIATDGMLVHFVREFTPEYLLSRVHCFGDFVSTLPGDPYAFIINGDYRDSSQSYGFFESELNYSANDKGQACTYCPQSYAGFGGSCALIRWVPRITPFIGGAGILSGKEGGLPFPNPTDGGFYLSTISLIESGNNVLRGSLPGVPFIQNNLPSQLEFGTRITGANNMTGRILFTFRTGTGGSGLVDITGPWRA